MPFKLGKNVHHRLVAQYQEVASVANYPLGWAQAANTPFKFWKIDANAEGATHNPLIVYYPKGIPAGTARKKEATATSMCI